MAFNWLKHSDKIMLIILMTTLSGMNIARADDVPPQGTGAQILDLIHKYGSPAKLGSDFYQAGIDCHRGQLGSIRTFDHANQHAFLFNDQFNNCIMVNFSSQDFVFTPSMCVISDSLFKQLTSDWNRDAIKSMDRTTNITPVIRTFFMSISQCLKPVSPTDLLNLMTTSPQVQHGAQ